MINELMAPVKSSAVELACERGIREAFLRLLRLSPGSARKGKEAPDIS